MDEFRAAIRASEIVRDLQRATEAARGLQRATEATRGLQRATEATRGLQRATEATRDLQRATEAARGLQRATEATRGLQRATEAVRGLQRATEAVLRIPEAAIGMRRLTHAVREVQRPYMMPAVSALFEINRVAAAEQIRGLSEAARLLTDRTRGIEFAVAKLPTWKPLFTVDHSASLLKHQLAWTEDIDSRLKLIHSGMLASAMEAARRQHFTLYGHVRDAIRTLDVSEVLGEDFPAESFAGEISTEVERATTAPDASSIGAAIASLVSRLTGVDASRRAQLFVVLLFVVIAALREFMGAVAEVEYERWRNSAEEAARSDTERHQNETLDAIRRQLEELTERVAHPPLPAEVIRGARVRTAPDTTASLVRHLKPGAHVVVLERRDGWVKVEAESVPGEVVEGWVYGRLIRYLR